MARKFYGSETLYISLLLAILALLLFIFTDKCSAGNLALSGNASSILPEFPWLEAGKETGNQDDGNFLSRVRRSTNETSGSKSIWQKIEEFYSDNNNMAMFCVLPIMVLIYGGCSAIYCVYKCRQYLRRRKHKRLKEEDDCESLTSGKNDNQQGLDMNKNGPVSKISHGWTDLQVNPTEKRWSELTDGKRQGNSSPLPWQVPSKTEAAAALAHTNHRESGNSSRASYVNDKLRDDTIPLQASAHDKPRAGGLDKKHPPPIKAAEPQAFEATRAHANLADYATNKSSALKATDYSRFSESRPIEILPLNADPHLRVWDPLHNRHFGDESQPGRAAGGVGGARPAGVQSTKEDLLARYDALTTLQMAKKAAQILSNNAVEKNPFRRNPTKKNRNIYTTD